MNSEASQLLKVTIHPVNAGTLVNAIDDLEIHRTGLALLIFVLIISIYPPQEKVYTDY